MPEKVLAEKVALVTGGSRGIGRAVSLKLAECGASVAVNFQSSQGPAEEVVEEIRKAGGEAEAFGFDVSDDSAVDASVKEILERFGRLDILVNNAGVADDGLLVRTKKEHWERTLGINLSGSFFCARAAAKSMMRAKSGRIINISSVIGEMGNAGQAAYSASKAGLLGLTKSMARELGSRGITVNAVTPGYIETDMTSGLSDDHTAGILAQVPLGRLGKAEDVAELVSFLASASAAYITGQVIGINGGMYM